MTAGEKSILVVDNIRATTENVKELIEFMDSPSVVTAMPEDWLKRLGDNRLEALFVGPHLSDEKVGCLLRELKTFDPNVPVVMMRDKK